VSHSDGIERFGYRQELRRSIGFTDLVFYGLIFMVPIAPFGIFGTAYQQSGGMVPLAYAVALTALVFTAWSYAKMSAAFPVTGGVYNYAGRGIGAPVGFLAGWLILLDYLIVPTLLYVIASLAMSGVIPSVPPQVWLIIFIIANTVVNATGIKITLQAIRFFIVGEIAVLVTFLGVGMWGLAAGRGEFSFDPIFNSDTFSWELILSAASITVLSFLGFDGIALLAEENRGKAKALGRAMTAALLLAGVLFIVQTWVAALFVPDKSDLIANGDPAGDAFYRAAEVAADGHWLYIVCAAATAIAWGFADTMVAQVASSRLMYAMARDRQLPSFLSRVSVRFGVPVNAILLASGFSAVLGWITLENLSGDTFRIFGIAVMEGVELNSIGFVSSIINFGAICAFLALHLSVIWYFFVKQRSGQWFSHLIMPVLGLVVLGSVAYYTDKTAQFVALGWLIFGAVLMGILYLRGHGPQVPRPDESVSADPTRPVAQNR
jgi:amino acid transporter